MSISSMRRRAVPALTAFGAAAAAVLALAAPAAAKTGTSELSPEQAGFTATGAQFDTISAQVYLRGPAQYASAVAGLGESVQLWSAGSVAIFGVTASTTGSTYTPYAIVYDRSTHAMVVLNPSVQWCDPSACGSTIGTWNTGDTLSMRVTYNPSSGALVFHASPTAGDAGTSFSATYQAGIGESFNQARVGTDFGTTPWDASYSYSPPMQYIKVAVFSKVSLTTYSGHTSSMWTWWVHHALLANTEQQSSSDWVSVPSNLYNGGANFQTYLVPQSGETPNQPARS
ncbi:MAG TPA: hypothetical protein VGM53_10465 [Streptosporangiaceae bacterium]|jgi:hypothetical protein